jgi:hypothetical protein
MPTEAFPVRAPLAATPQNAWVGRLWVGLLGFGLLATGGSAYGQVCQNSADMEASTRTALETAAERYFEMSANGDTTSLKQNSIPNVAANFASIEAAVKENQPAFAGAHATVRPPFLLTADGAEPLARAEFLCGVFGKNGQTKDSAEFVLQNLPPGKYGLTILDVNGGKMPMTLTLVLQQIANDWRLAGFFATPSQAAGHDAAWYQQRARDFKAKSQNHNAWLYDREAIALSAPVDFMSTLATDKLYDELQSVQPSDIPTNGNTLNFTVVGKTYRLTEIFPLAVGSDLDVVVKYQAADVSDAGRTFQDNTAVIKALVAKFPELRDAFAGVVARAVDPSGRDYGTLLPMKEIK